MDGIVKRKRSIRYNLTPLLEVLLPIEGGDVVNFRISFKTG